MRCPTCNQEHREDYRVWSDYFQCFMTSAEFVRAVYQSIEQRVSK